MRTPILLFAILAGSALPVALAQEPKGDRGELVRDRTAFGLALHRRFAAAGGNVFFSPQSVFTTIEMVRVGATGETAAEIASALHTALPDDRLLRAHAGLMSEVKRTGYELRAGSALFAQKGERFGRDFSDRIERGLGGELFAVDFAKRAEAARAEVNDWASRKTGGKIPAILGPTDVDRDTAFVLANAVFFSAKWRSPFPASGTWEGTFTSPDGAVKAPLMHDTLGPREAAGYRYGESAGLQALAIPYKGDELSLVVLLPPAGQLERLEGRLDRDALAGILDSLAPLPRLLGERKNPTIEITLPRFKARTRVDLKPHLKALGAKRVFSERDAELRGIVPDRATHLSAVLHEAVIELDEQGTQAAAATTAVGGFSFGDGPPPPPQPIRFTADRPFVYLLRHDATGLIFFMGRLVDPTKG